MTRSGPTTQSAGSGPPSQPARRRFIQAGAPIWPCSAGSRWAGTAANAGLRHCPRRCSATGSLRCTTAPDSVGPSSTACARRLGKSTLSRCHCGSGAPAGTGSSPPGDARPQRRDAARPAPQPVPPRQPGARSDPRRRPPLGSHPGRTEPGRQGCRSRSRPQRRATWADAAALTGSERPDKDGYRVRRAVRLELLPAGGGGFHQPVPEGFGALCQGLHLPSGTRREREGLRICQLECDRTRGLIGVEAKSAPSPRQ